MTFDMNRMGNQIAALRKQKGLTQTDLGERLSVSAQAVSKWERGESLPDISLLTDLATILETTTDNLLSSGSKPVSYGRKITVQAAREAIACFEKIGDLLGRDNAFYLGAIEGVNQRMNIDLEEYLREEYTREAMVAEAIIQCVQCGAYVDMSDVKREFTNEHWIEIIRGFAVRAGIA